jgi:DNA-directed RNA polymerase subunit L
MEFNKNGVCNIITETEYDLEFTIHSIDVSTVNALRRTILSDIPTVVFRTSPPEKDQCVVHKNSTSLNNEVIKHRLGGIPIHHLHTIPDDYIESIVMELNVENTTDQYLMVTSKDFRIKNKADNTYLPADQVVKIFPPSKVVQSAYGIDSYTDLVRLRPKLHDMPGDKIHLTCEFSWGAAFEDSNFNVVSTCAYSYLRDETRVTEEYAKKRQELEALSLESSEVEFKLRDWMLLDSYRYIVNTEFNFIIETLGVFTNKEILVNAVNILIHTLQTIDDHLVIERGTVSSEYKILLYKDDYTIGKLIETTLFKRYFEHDRIISYVGFKKFHPHDEYVTIRVHYLADLGDTYPTIIIGHVQTALGETRNTLEYIKSQFE